MRASTKDISSALNLYYDGHSVRAIGRHFQQENGHTPSTATIYEWVQRYTHHIIDSIKDYHPQVGDVWIADETVLKIGGQKLWLWDIIDDKTRVLLASRLSRSRTTRDAQILIDKAVKVAGKHPQSVITDKLASYLDIDYGKDAEHRQGSPFSTEDSTSKIERWHGTIKSRTKVMRGLKNIESAHDFTDGYLAYYNYLRPHESLENRTPAEVAGISYPYRNWEDVIRNYKPAIKIEITHVERGTLKLPRTQIGRPHKRLPITPKRPRLPRGDVYVGRGMLSRHPFKGGQARRGRII